MTDTYINLDTLPTPEPSGEPVPALAASSGVLLGRHAVYGPTGELLAFAVSADAAEVLRGAIDRADARDAAQAAARERGWQRDLAQKERDQARRELADLRAQRDREDRRVVTQALGVLRERDQLRARLSDALATLDRVGTDAAAAADRGAGE